MSSNLSYSVASTIFSIPIGYVIAIGYATHIDKSCYALQNENVRVCVDYINNFVAVTSCSSFPYFFSIMTVSMGSLAQMF